MNYLKAKAHELIFTSLYGEEERERIERFINRCDAVQLNATIEVLKINQLDPILQRGNYSMTDIQNKLIEHT